MPNFITLPRSELYERVWSKPVRDVAKEFGISDVALAKRCRTLRIPLPPRGYWARVAAGQKPKRPPLPRFTERKRSALPGYVTTRDAEGQPAAEPALQFEMDRRSQTVTATDVNAPAVTGAPTANLSTATAIVKRTARHLKHPNRAELDFARGEGNGPILHLHVSPEMLDRALLFADTFLRACGEQGWTPVAPPPPKPPDPRHYYGRPPEPTPHVGPHYAELDVNGHRIEFHLEEPFDLRELPPTQAELNRQKRDNWFRPEKRHERIWSGRLRLRRPGYRYPYGIDGKSWYDTRGRSVETLLPRILADLQVVAARMQEKDEELEREERERERQAKLAAQRTPNSSTPSRPRPALGPAPNCCAATSAPPAAHSTTSRSPSTCKASRSTFSPGPSTTWINSTRCVLNRATPTSPTNATSTTGPRKSASPKSCSACSATPGSTSRSSVERGLRCDAPHMSSP